ncbi:PE family protein [Saccharopolyspora antimicrobica]|uniref:PE family protein n=1 Tax=Saccharopolyspora antimicrobica TaxID=455193 RepID=A0A1I5BIZ6_9PSEU|nr:PE domain-containing protein [Saccharopolyspora antimicrobica]RKT86624.1 PE family protein [Saccharopolyspora antimicrobica]SFN74620.1 PE family protein [Saccharopolyspora antimicrobica]
MSEGDGGTYRSVDQNVIDAARVVPGPAGFIGNAMNIMTRAADNAALAAAQSAGGSMRIEPDQVDKLAQFFKEEATRLEDRQQEVFSLSRVKAPGKDPVSTQVADRYGQVAAGNETAYLNNYLQLAKVLKETAANLEASARQTRTDDQNAEDSIRS